MTGGIEMNLPIFGAEAALYTSSTHYRAAGSWTNGADIQVGLSQLGAPAALRTPIICDGSCPPPHCTHHCGPCVTNPAEPTGCARTCTTCCPGEGCDTSFSDCPAQSCCTEAPVCGPCAGQTCQGTFPNCSGTPGTGTQSCTACGSTFTRPC
jgi:hypothetical protein